MDLHALLKQETRRHHDQIETSPLLNKIMDGSITLTEYRLLIEKFYAYILPCERLVKQLPWHDMLVDREKSPLLAQDLQSLGHSQQALSNISHCPSLPDLTKREHVLGYLYVIEGSTLGGQVILKLLGDKFKLTPETGVSYFAGFGRETKARWNAFCQDLNQVTHSEQQHSVISAANITYTTLNNWMSE
jgi:heme oxygenase